MPVHVTTKIINNQPYQLAGYCKKLARYSFLIRVLAVRELKIKYNRTLLGISWLFFQPLVLVIVYSLFFEGIINISTGAIPYPSFVFSGLVLWYLFTGIVGKTSFALLESAELIHKVSFPRVIILLARIVPVLLECLALLVLLFCVLLFTHQNMGIQAFTAIFYFVQVAVFSFAIGLLCSMAVVRYRDLAHVIPFVMNFAIWLTPVFYPVALVPPAYQHYLLYLNPLAFSLEGLRGALFFNTGIPAASWLTLMFSGFFLLFSFYYFIKFEKKLVETL